MLWQNGQGSSRWLIGRSFRSKMCGKTINMQKAWRKSFLALVGETVAYQHLTDSWKKNMVLLVHSHFINGAGSLGEKQLGIGACLPVWLFGIWLQCLAVPCIEVSVRTINFGSFGQGWLPGNFDDLEVFDVWEAKNLPSIYVVYNL